MMRYPLLSRVRPSDGAQLYLQGTRFQVRTCNGVERRGVAVAGLPELIEREFGVRSTVARGAIAALSRQGELRAGAFVL